MREVQTHLERTARLTVAMTAVCVEESEKREGWSLKGKSFSALHCQESSTCGRRAGRPARAPFCASPPTSRAKCHVESVSGLIS